MHENKSSLPTIVSLGPRRNDEGLRNNCHKQDSRAGKASLQQFWNFLLAEQPVQEVNL